MKDKSVLIKEYLTKIKSANKELAKKEIFKDLLNRLYAGNSETEKVIDDITLGAEKTIVNIPRKDRLHKGSADTLYNKIIIEYENNLSTSLHHAKEQLAGYLLGEFSRGEGYDFTLIASDFITWKVFAPNVDQLDNIENLKEDELQLDEVVSASFTLTERNAEDFYFWIDRFLFKEEKQRATLKRIEEAFGYQSNIFIESFRELSSWFKEAKKYGEVQVSFEQWKKFLSIAYGKFDANEKIFLIHTYLSVFSKMLAYSIVSNDDYIDEEELKGILDGEIFNKYNIRNFIDNDFFHWVKSDRNFRNLKKAFRLIAQEISTFDFNDIDEDVLKGVYQELIDLDTRHALGEYYTPDWLCERVVNEFDFKENSKVLDPACGSGSFLRAAVHRMKRLHPEITPEELSNQIYGIDIHPLSVQIAKTTFLLSLGKEIRNLKRPIHINVILSNTLKIPEGVRDLFGSNFRMDIDKDKFLLTTHVLEDLNLFDVAVDVCEELAEQTLNGKKASLETLENSLRRQYKLGGINKLIAESFYKIYEGLKKVKEAGRDSIWKFILQNLYKPYFLSAKFDFIIGNPPWFTYSSIKNEEYQDTLNVLAEKYHVKPDKIANFPHLEIAAIFLAHCSNYFLNENGKLAFVLPRSFFSADHHDNTRSGKAKGFKLTAAWDLKSVSPLFRIPSCVLFAEKKSSSRKINKEGFPGLELSGSLPEHNCNWNEATPKLTEEDVTWFYIKQGKATALSTTNSKSSGKVNFYKKEFKQGATIVPRSFYFVQLTQEVPDFEDRTLHIKTADAIKPDAKMPWKEIDFNGMMDSRFLFRTALSKSILPFVLYKPNLVVLPIIIETENDIKRIVLQKPKDLQRAGYLNAARWFIDAENIWKIHRTEKNKTISSENYLNWQNKLTEQNLNNQFIVLYNTSGKDANSVVVDRTEIDLEFLADHKAYILTTNNSSEAYYISAFLNSNAPNLSMKDFQSRGLFGARDVHKKILDVYFPKFNQKQKTHVNLALLSEQAHAKAKAYVEANLPKQELSAIHLGRYRVEIKKHLKEEMDEIDGLVGEMIK
ncbi:MAG: N-6 DNA methylase [Bacteroidota bacterium]|nr:N-6 DNA methylase [Bacteroidota bacterium]